MLKYKVGQKLTIVNKGIRRSAYTDSVWVDSIRRGHACFFQVSKVGRIYLYGHYFYNDRDNNDKLTMVTYAVKVIPEDNVIHEGFREDLIKQYVTFLKAVKVYDEKRKIAMYDVDREVWKFKDKLIKAWEKENPRVKELEL